MGTTAVQRALVALGYSLVVDGKPRPATKAAIQAFQRGRGLAADGVVEPLTIAALQKATKQGEEPAASTSVVLLTGCPQLKWTGSSFTGPPAPIAAQGSTAAIIMF
ncbi:peptidoglycan hydrolase-like protein with peptidoglycan-binding domain [Bosea sp. OAE752]|uniref:peptidoglycan-binding domain-containing protein n=1 Tax=Bosea sp. OAE752 TaxID=2663873 RepID=UPI003D1FEEBD